MSKPLNRALPRTLYKYRAPATETDFGRIEEMITHGKYFCSSPKLFNDVFDCKPVMGFDVSDKEYVNGYIQIARKHHDRRLREILIKEAKGYIGTTKDPRHPERTVHLQKKMHDLMDGWGVFCLTENPDDILMWAHYAVSYSGICIEITTDRFAYLAPVGYSDVRPVIRWLDSASIEDRARDGLYTKSSHWSYEDEWRVMHDANKYVELGPGTVKRIIFGPNCAESTVEKIIEIAKLSDNEILLHRAVPNQKKFAIDIVEFGAAK